MARIIGGDFIASISGGVFEQVDGSIPVSESLETTPTKLDRKIRPKVVRLLKKYGKVLVYRDDSANSYDRSTGKKTTLTPVSYSKYSLPPKDFELKYIDGDIVKVGDCYTGVAGKAIEFTPKRGMEVVIDSTTWKIQRIRPIYSGNLIALWMFHLRK